MWWLCNNQLPKVNHITLLLQFPLYTMMVFDEWYNGVPVAYLITSNYKQCDLAPWMDALNKSLLMVKNVWHPNAFIVDDVKVALGKFPTTHIFILWVLVSKHGHIFYCKFMLPGYVLGTLHVFAILFKVGLCVIGFCKWTRCCCL